MLPLPSSLVDGDSPHEPARLTDHDPLAGLSGWLADGRVDEAAADRARQRWLERQAAEEATIAGVLLDLAERGRPVTVRTVGGRTVRGRVSALGADFVFVREARLGDVAVPLARVATVRASSGEDPAVGDRPPALAVVFAEALSELAVDRPLVLVSVAGDDIRGELRSAGTDVIAVAIDTPRREVVHVSTNALDHLVLLSR